MAPFTTTAHSSSVSGSHSSTPSTVMMVPEESHTASAAGSRMFRIRPATSVTGASGGPLGSVLQPASSTTVTAINRLRMRSSPWVMIEMARGL